MNDCVSYTANWVNCDILISNSKPQIPRLKFQILAFKVFKQRFSLLFSLGFGIWNLRFGIF